MCPFLQLFSTMYRIKKRIPPAKPTPLTPIFPHQQKTLDLTKTKYQKQITKKSNKNLKKHVMYRYLLDKICVSLPICYLKKSKEKIPPKNHRKNHIRNKMSRNSCYVPGQRGSPRQRPPVFRGFARDRPTAERRVRIAGLIKGN